ncbi:Cthe_2314 family HEPN domain-containing protein [Cognatilysobacter bugurensis]|uniref:Cthe-2314-like HEPN domain-containing protein n=1 Tax=Cognatilysobacter bugurensis TaxID=543356 RepID=A0A918W924_9GAMM|nr:Cthe_2314 family HEPN domain-containing protein [Lysobacter bugurensis]GHA83062.1 hypothetical protein GCM10007067_21460 [Lysobacter bugurensis]
MTSRAEDFEHRLKKHPFLAALFEDISNLETRAGGASFYASQEELNEYTFYVRRVGYALAHLITWTEQLDHCIYYISDFNYGGKARRNGITRADYLLYTIENYLIRLQSTYDKALQLTNAIFHLCIQASNVSHALVVSNLRVSRTDVPARLKAVKRAIRDKQQDRNSIIHQGSFERDKKLSRLELFYLQTRDSWAATSTDLPFENFQLVRRDLMREVLRERKAEFGAINEKLFFAVDELLTSLQAHYQMEAKRVRKIAYD